MNRIQLLDPHANLTQRTPQSRRKHGLTSKGSTGAKQQSFFVPMHYEPNYAYPLLVWLHGPHDNHQQLRQVMPHVSMRNYVAVAPASRETLRASAPYADDPWQQTESSIVDALQQVEQAIDKASSRFNIGAHRIFLAGVDQGGTMALRLGMAAPGHFAGVASFGGPFPDGYHPLANLSQARDLPVLIGHGRDSDRYPVTRVCQDLRLFHVAGMSLNLRQYPCGQELTTQMLSDLDAWMMEIVTGATTSTASMPSQLPFDDVN